MPDPSVRSPLTRTDGSSQISEHGYSVICGVNGPVEVQRRDELPEEAAIDIDIRPASGVGEIRERYLEGIMQRVLRHVILVSAYPRSMIQITLQIVKNQTLDAHSSLPASASGIDLLPALFQATILSLLDAAIPLTTTMTCAMIAVDSADRLHLHPDAKTLDSSSSRHVFGFSAEAALLLLESEGSFTMEIVEQAHASALRECLGNAAQPDGVDGIDEANGTKETNEANEANNDAMQIDSNPPQDKSLQTQMRATLKAQAASDTRWQANLG